MNSLTSLNKQHINKNTEEALLGFFWLLRKVCTEHVCTKRFHSLTLVQISCIQENKSPDVLCHWTLGPDQRSKRSCKNTTSAIHRNLEKSQVFYLIFIKTECLSVFVTGKSNYRWAIKPKWSSNSIYEL